MAIGDLNYDKVVFGSDFEPVSDKSTRKLAVSLVSGATQRSAQAKYGTSSLYTPGTSGASARVTGTSSELNFGVNDFTIEGWFYYAGSAVNYPVIFASGHTTWNSGSFNFTFDGTGNTDKLVFSIYGQTAVVSNSTLAYNTWHHFAVVRASGVISLFVNGTKQTATLTFASALDFGGGVKLAYFGCASHDGSQAFTGYLDDIRVSNGLARYAANFTPAQCTFYYAQIEGTVKDANGNLARRLVRAHRRSDGLIVDEKLSDPSTGAFTLNTWDASKHYAVVHDSDAWITYLPFNGDNNSTIFPEWGGKTVTPYGNVKISTAQSKFGGVSCVFDGAGDYLTLPNSPDLDVLSGDFTIELWVRFSSVAGTQGVVAGHAMAAGLGESPYLIYLGSGNLVFYASSNGITWDVASAQVIKSAVAINTWYHVAVVRSGNSILLFCDGVLTTTVVVSGALASIGANTPSIGQWQNGNYFNGYIDDLRISKGKAQYIGNFTPPTVPHFTEQAGDPYWNNVVLAMHMDGQPDNGDTHRNSVVLNMRGNTLLDDTGKVITAAGNASVVDVTGRTAFGGKAISFDGSGDYLNSPNNPQFNFGTGDFTVECWVRPASVATAYQEIVAFNDSSTGANSGLYCILAGSELRFNMSLNGTTFVGGVNSSGANLQANAWTHVAWVRQSGTLMMFANGVLVSTVASTFAGSAWFHSTQLLGVAANPIAVNSYPFTGHIDDLRITKGVARYTATFTPPATELPPLIRTFPEAKSGKLVTAYGDAKVSAAQSKFGGYSAYFDGTGDYLGIYGGVGLGVADFTIECWVRFDSLSKTIASSRLAVSTSANYWNFYVDAVGALGFQTRDTTEYYALSANGAISINTWYHVAATRSGGVLRVFINGVVGPTTGNDGSFAIAETDVAIGLFNYTGFVGYMHGYIDDFIITKGIARYTANFTPPNAAFYENLQTFGQKNALIYDHLTPV